MKAPLPLLLCAALLTPPSCANAEGGAPAAPLSNLTLEQAVEMSEERHPQLAESRALVERARGRAKQAGAFPNPEAVVGAEQIPFQSGSSDEREYVAGFSVTLPIGGRLGKARQAEEFAQQSQSVSLDAMRREIRRRIQDAFATALFQDRAFQFQNELVQDLQKVVKITQARVDAGDAAPGDLPRVQIELTRSELELKRIATMHRQSMLTLASAIGDPQLPIRSLSGNLDEAFSIPAIESVSANVDLHPQSALAAADLQAKIARVKLAKSERIPDVKIQALYHRLEGPGENTVDIGFSVPLPLFDRNQGRIKEAEADRLAAEARLRMTQNSLSERMLEAREKLSTALSQSRALKEEILPRTKTVMTSMEARYAAGDINLSEILPVRRDLVTVQFSYLESLRDVMHAWAELSQFAESKPKITR